MSRYVVLSTSLNPKSRSRLLAQMACDRIQESHSDVELIDISTLDLPLCDASSCYGHPNVVALAPRIASARGIIVATAIYNYDVNAAAKNVLELTGDAWTDKVVGFICAAGGQGSYMALMNFANSLMLDYRCMIVPRFVYAPPFDAGDETFSESAIGGRIQQLTGELTRVTEALFPRSQTD